MIKKFINCITKDEYYPSGYQIRGDGQGDFEKWHGRTTEKCLENYIYDCEAQITVAKELLEKMRSKV